jgi:membrane-associated phospholipid phosphatase
MDNVALQWVSRRRSHRLIRVMRGFSFSGNASTVALGFAAALWCWPDDVPTLRAGVATLIGLCCFFVLKRTVRRARPHGSVVAAPDPFSLPSGHATCAWAISISLLSAHPLVSLLAFGWAITVSLSRVILGVHYPLDVVAGMLLGSVAAVVAAVGM